LSALRHGNLGLFNQPDPRSPYNCFWKAGQGVSALRNPGSNALHAGAVGGAAAPDFARASWSVERVLDAA
jgi:hypothetical protein